MSTERVFVLVMECRKLQGRLKKDSCSPIGPLLGPSSLARLRAEIARLGRNVALPDLAPALPTSVWDAPALHAAYIQKAVDAGDLVCGPSILIGHSGAGPFLPTIADALAGPVTLVFVDAALPPVTGSFTPPAPLLAMLDRHTVDGMLEPWLDWWPLEVVSQLLPNTSDQRVLRSDMPRVPRSFYDAGIAVPEHWANERCGYVQLSAAYDNERIEAESRGWPTVELTENHLAVHTAPGDVLEAILELTRRLER